MLKDRKPATAEALVSTVAGNIRALREQKGLSLTELAQQAGIGKATLSMLESGGANPNIETLWALAVALGVTFAELIQPRSPEVRVVRAGEGLHVDAQHSTFRATLLVSGASGGNRFEIYTFESEPGPVREADGHIKGSVEHIYLVAGKLRVGPDGKTVELAPGDLASFAGDARHSYEALKKGTKGVMVMEYT